MKRLAVIFLLLFCGGVTAGSIRSLKNKSIIFLGKLGDSLKLFYFIISPAHHLKKRCQPIDTAYQRSS